MLLPKRSLLKIALQETKFVIDIMQCFWSAMDVSVEFLFGLYKTHGVKIGGSTASEESLATHG